MEAFDRFEWLSTDDGVLVAMPKVVVDRFRARGLLRILLDVPIAVETEWLTVTAAARAHLDDVDGMTMQTAQAKISQACTDGRIRSRGNRKQRRIDPARSIGKFYQYSP